MISAWQRSSRLMRRLLSPQCGAAIAEHCMLARSWEASTPQLFILGLPRSGTTLIYQYLVHRLRVAYFTNGVGDYHRSPCFTTWWQLRKHGEYRSDFQNHHGKVDGPLAPREAGAVWARFFGVDDRIAPGDLHIDDMRRLRNMVACVQSTFGDLPFVNKNVKHLLRLEALARAFPEAHFLVVTREAEDVARSLMRCRQELLHDTSAWWSLRPLDFERLRHLDPAAQVAGQVQSLTDELKVTVAKLPSFRVHHVAYSDFCAHPEGLVARMQRAIGPIGYRNPSVPEFRVPVHRNDTADERRLAALVHEAVTR